MWATVGLTAAIVTGGVHAFGARWSLSYDVQKYYRCLPYSVYLTQTSSSEKAYRVGDLVKFKAPAWIEQFDHGFPVTKIVGAVAGDAWRVTNDVLYVRGVPWGRLDMLKVLGHGPGDLDRSGVVPEGQVFLLGTSPSSFDSRYWGPIDASHITGRAHAIF